METCGSDSPSAYESIRFSNIARNNCMLASLGLTRDSSECALLPQGMDKPLAPRRKRKREESVEGNIKSNTVQRRSKRLQNIQNGVTISATLIEQDVIVKKETSSLQVQRRMQDKKSGIVVSNELNYGTHIGKVLKESDFDVSKVVDKWDKNKIHQHLTLSKSHRTVVTTGCAGYGGVLACNSKTAIVRKAGKSNNSKRKSESKVEVTAGACKWRLRVMCEGVGGFAAGVAMKNTPYPFKSLGNRKDAWVIHSSGILLHNRSQTSLLKGKCKTQTWEYGEGDIVDVVVETSAGVLRFEINGKNVDREILLPAGEYVLCCQPYMGGAARLLNC